MSIVKKLPAVLIAAVGISFSFVGTALAEKPILAEKTLGRTETLRIPIPAHPSPNTNIRICSKTTGSRTLLHPLIINYPSATNGVLEFQIGPRSNNLPRYVRRASSEGDYRDYECIVIRSIGRRPADDPNLNHELKNYIAVTNSHSMRENFAHVYAREEP